ncbi:methyl-accepting chemotaxis protein [Bacteriovorax stolpii]|nr:methyl-accepting chemotaxis protein [Bacteriovorax stolpii]
MLKSKHLRTRMAFAIISVITLILVAMTVYNYKKSSALIQEEAFGKANYLALNYAKNIESDINEAFSKARSLASTLSRMKEKEIVSNRDVVVEMIGDIVKSKKDFYYGSGTFWEPNAWDGKDHEHAKKFGAEDSGLFGYWYRKDGKGDYVLDPTTAEQAVKMYKPGDGDWYLIPMQSKKESMIEPYEYTTNSGDKMVLTSPSVPIILNGKFLGITSVDITLNSVIDLINSIKPYDVGYAMLIASDGNVVSHPNKDLVMKPLADELMKGLIKKSNEEKKVEDSLSADGKDYIVIAPIKLGESGKYWSLIVIIPVDKVLAGSITLAKTQVLFSILALIIVSLIIYFLAQSIAKPLSVSSDSVHQTGIDLYANSEKLMKVSESLSSSSTEQSAALVETATAMDEINAMVQANTSAARRGREASQDSRSAALEGKNATEEMIRSIQDIRESTTKISEQTNKSNIEVQEILTIFQAISDKTKVINDIVFQTKLLSFNASVEAARAGEQGKGFSVVAEEVGKLAEMSGHSSTEIADLLSSSTEKVEQIIQKNKAATEGLVVEANQKVKAGIQTAEVCTEALEKIIIGSDQVAQLVEEIFSASEQQAAGVAEVSKAIAELEVQAQSNSTLAQEAATSAQIVNQKSDALKTVANELRSVIEGSAKE